MKATPLLMIAALWCGVASAATDTEALEREMNIMREILRTVSKSEESRSIGIGDVSAHYLPSQGVLFGTSLHNRWGYRGRFPEIDLSDVPDFVTDIVADVRASIPYPYVDAEELETLRELREEQRDLREEQRDLRRELRDQRRELDRALAQDAVTNDPAAHQLTKSAIEEKIEELEAELAASEKHYDALAQDIEIEHKRFREEREDRYRQRRIAREQAYAALETRLLQTLCDYGATLKSLPDREHVNLLIENARRENGHEHDRVYVFEKEDLLACQRQSIDLAKLRERATIYDQ